MFCIQCEQTIRTPVGDGCSYAQGMCGKTSEVSDLQDILVYVLQGVSFWADLGRKFNIVDTEVDEWAPQAFFSTLTNVNFDADRIVEFSNQAYQYKVRLEEKVRAAATLANETLPELTPAAQFALPTEREELLKYAPLAAVNRGHETVDPDVMGLRLLALYGLKRCSGLHGACSRIRSN